MLKIFIFSQNCIQQLLPCTRQFHLIINQIKYITTQSLPLTLIVAVFTGGIIVVQSISQLGNFIPLQYVGIATQKSILIDLGPVLTAIIVAGKLSGSITAELGAMAISEQLDFMEINNLNPFKYLINPCILAGMISLPLLTIFAAGTAIVGSLLILILFYDTTTSSFVYGLRLFYQNKDVFVSLTKSVFFGFLITSFGCYFGYHCKGGPKEIGHISQFSVMTASIAILIGSYIISIIFL